MQISSISSITPVPSALPAQPATSRVSNPDTAAPSATAVGTAHSAAAPAAATSPGESPSPRPVAAEASSQPQSAAASAANNLLADVYSTTVAGKSYSGSVEESGGEYTASVPNLPGASATGASVDSAENNLTLIIDTLV